MAEVLLSPGVLAQELEKKYGRGTVNLESGEFIQA